MLFEWIRTIIALPGVVLVFIPAAVLYALGWRWETPSWPMGAAGGFLLLCGASLALWTMWLFGTKGDGTPAPWNPPKKLVVKGPYRHVRNPMITSVLMLLVAEALLLNAPEILWVFACFWLGNAFYFPLVEEKALEKRFGAAYRDYKRQVPRWIPQWRPYQPSGENGAVGRTRVGH